LAGRRRDRVETAIIHLKHLETGQREGARKDGSEGLKSGQDQSTGFALKTLPGKENRRERRTRGRKGGEGKPLLLD